MQWQSPTRFGAPRAEAQLPAGAAALMGLAHDVSPLANWSMRCANSTSRRVRPSASWVESVTSTLL
jgi:hypothetical protein